jgi:hypothetical protein
LPAGVDQLRIPAHVVARVQMGQPHVIDAIRVYPGSFQSLPEWRVQKRPLVFACRRESVKPVLSRFIPVLRATPGGVRPLLFLQKDWGENL